MNESIERSIHFTGPLMPSLDGGGLSRNLGRARKDGTTVNFDFLGHHSGAGGQAIGLRGSHALMLPWVAAALLKREP